MRDLVLGFAPIVVMWLLPLAPMFYAAIAAVVEAVTKRSRRDRPDPVTARELST